jgi:hypothetical protein
MLKPIHAEITRRALTDSVGPRAIQAILAANLGQDALPGQIGHDEFHFDNNAFDASRAYIARQRGLIRPALEAGDPGSAWRAFGRLTHAGQDFYAHSNYVDLWLSCQAKGMAPSPGEIDPLDPDLMDSPALRSGKLYYPLEVLSFVPGVKKLVIPLLPRDSHAWMNLDSPGRGPLFEYAFQAAFKRTRREFELATRGLTAELHERFADRPRIPGYDTILVSFLPFVHSR